MLIETPVLILTRLSGRITMILFAVLDVQQEIDGLIELEKGQSR